MKKTAFFLAVIMILSFVLPCFSSAKTENKKVSVETKESVSGDYRYIVESGTATITDYVGKAEILEIPDFIGGFPVTRIGDGAFKENNTLVSVIIPYGVTIIGASAFYRCSILAHVSLPDSLLAIGEGAFEFCEALSNVMIPNGVLTIGDKAFWFCGALTQITIPSSVISMSTFTFSTTTNLTMYVIPGSYAERYAKEKNIKIEFIDASDIILRGDVNLDGKVNSRDVAEMQKHILQIKIIVNDKALRNADVNGNGKINSSDIAALQKRIIRK